MTWSGNTQPLGSSQSNPAITLVSHLLALLISLPPLLPRLGGKTFGISRFLPR
ncbi:hypothetical protein CsatB_002916 [Cannabis sativa]